MGKTFLETQDLSRNGFFPRETPPSASSAYKYEFQSPLLRPRTNILTKVHPKKYYPRLIVNEIMIHHHLTIVEQQSFDLM